jgi:hypothetical protein
MMFFLSFHGPGGLCRISHGQCKQTAISDCIRTAIGTGMTCNLLDDQFKVVGHTHQRNGHFYFEENLS